MSVSIEVTDTFGGEANYAWVNRYKIQNTESMSDYAIVRQAKRMAGWNGKPCKREHYGDMIRLTPYGTCMTMFINLWD